MCYKARFWYTSSSKWMVVWAFVQLSWILESTLSKIDICDHKNCLFAWNDPHVHLNNILTTLTSCTYIYHNMFVISFQVSSNIICIYLSIKEKITKTIRLVDSISLFCFLFMFTPVASKLNNNKLETQSNTKWRLIVKRNETVWHQVHNIWWVQ